MEKADSLVLALPYAYMRQDKEFQLVSTSHMHQMWVGNLNEIAGISIDYDAIFLCYALTRDGNLVNLNFRRNRYNTSKIGKFPYAKEIPDVVVVTAHPCSVWYTPRNGRGIFCVYFDHNSGWGKKQCVDNEARLIPFSPLSVVSDGRVLAGVQLANGAELGAVIDAANNKLTVCRYASDICCPLPKYPQWYKHSVSEEGTICKVFSARERLATFVAYGVAAKKAIAGIDKYKYGAFAVQLNDVPETLLTIFSMEGAPDWAAVISGIPEQLYFCGKTVLVAMRISDQEYELHEFYSGVYSSTGILPSRENKTDKRLIDISNQCIAAKLYHSALFLDSKIRPHLEVALTIPDFSLAKPLLQEAGLPHRVTLRLGKELSKR